MAGTIDAITILHVDDEPDFADLTATCLEREDDRFAVETAISASEALAEYDISTFDCIVSDHDMSGSNGIEFLETVREDHPDLPFILYTGKGSEEIASDAISAGVTDYLQKESGTSQYTVLANRIRNVVEKYSVQTELASREKRLNLFFEQSPLGVVEWDENFNFVRLNDAAERILGYREDALVGRSWEVIVPETDREPVDDIVSDLLDNAGGYRSVNENVRKNGERIVCEWHNRVVTDDSGDVVAIFSQFQDITEQKEREQELREEKAFIEQSLDALDDILYFVDTDGDFKRWNSTLPELTGYSDEEIGSMNALEFFEGDHRETIRGSIHEILENGSHATEAKITTADGRHVPHEFRGVRMTDDEGEPAGIIGIARDITERKERERELEQKTEELEQLATRFEDQYRTLFEEAPVMAVVTRVEDGQPIIEDCNSQFVETLGYDENAIIGSGLEEFYTPNSAETLLEEDGYERSLAGEFTREKRDLMTADGEVVETLLRAVPRRTADSEIIGTVAMYIDITEREAVKRANERLEEFTSVVSHDLRNPLNVAVTHLELAAEECDSDHLNRADQALDRMRSLIDELLTLAREEREVTDPQAVDLATILDASWETVETNGASLSTAIDREVWADSNRLRQVFENLFRNAVEHGGTCVTVTVGELPDGFYVEDDGSGVPPSERDEVFEAGYSGSAEGTGFGLSIVKQVVNAHGWQIRVTDGSNGGARFEITDVEFVSA